MRSPEPRRIMIENKLLKAIEASVGLGDKSFLLSFALDEAPIVRSHVLFNPRADIDLARILHEDRNDEVKRNVLNFLYKLANGVPSLEERIQITLIALAYVKYCKSELRSRAKTLFKRMMRTLPPEIRLEIFLSLDDERLMVEVTRSVELTSGEIEKVMSLVRAGTLSPLIAENLILGKNLLRIPWNALISFYSSSQLSERQKSFFAYAIVNYLLYHGLDEEMANDIILHADRRLIQLIAREPELVEMANDDLKRLLREEAPEVMAWYSVMEAAQERREKKLESLAERIEKEVERTEILNPLVTLIEKLNELFKGAFSHLSTALEKKTVALLRSISRIFSVIPNGNALRLSQRFAQR